MTTNLGVALDRVWVRVVTWTLIVGLYVVYMLRRHWTPADYYQQSAAFEALMHGHLSSVYPLHNYLTSPPGFLIVGAPVVAALGERPSGTVSGPVLGLLSAVFLAASALWMARTVHPEPAPVRDRLLVSAVLLGSPFTYSLVGAYHPEDLVAMGFLLLATAAAIRRQVVGVGLALAAALLTRQWALLAVGPLLLYLGPGWRKATVTAALVTSALLAPFVILSPLGLFTALTATNGLSVGPFSVWQYAHFGGNLAYAVARAAPLALSILTSLLLRRRWRQSSPGWCQLVGALIVTCSYRVVFDPDSLMYYLIPLCCLLLVIGLYDPRRRDRLVAVMLAVAIQFLLSYEPLLYYFPVTWRWLRESISAGSELAFIGACAAGWGLSRVRDVDDGSRLRVGPEMVPRVPHPTRRRRAGGHGDQVGDALVP